MEAGRQMALVQDLAGLNDQIKSRDRVRDLAEVYTHEREVNAMLALIPGMFPSWHDPLKSVRPL